MGTTLSLATSAFAADRVIYGEDNRLDIYEVSNDQHLEYAKATAILVNSSDLRASGSSFALPTSTLQQNQRVCADEPFAQQPTPGFCSGFLVGPDIFVTAGHCITSASKCASTSMVFGYKISDASNTPDAIKSNDVYTCKEIISRQLSGGKDYAVIKLDRAVAGVTPLKFRTSGKITTGEDLVMIGHPSGLPSKVAAGAIVRGNSDPEFFVATTDSYGGNSGSAVINDNTGEVEGILVRGETDYVYDSSKGCYVSKVCATDACRGEDVTRASLFAPFVSTQPQNPSDVLVAEFAQSTDIPDNLPAGVSIDMEIVESAVVQSVSIETNITHTYSGDIAITIIHPDGSSAVVRPQSGGSLDNVIGTFSTAAFAGKEAAGIWKVKVADLARLDRGTIHSLKLSIAVQ